MDYYIINKEMADKYKIPIAELERVFSYTTFTDMRFKLEEIGFTVLSDSQLQNFSNFLIMKFEDDYIERMISYLRYRGKINLKQ